LEVNSVHASQGIVSVLLVFESDKTESTGSASVTVSDHTNLAHIAILRKSIFKVTISSLKIGKVCQTVNNRVSVKINEGQSHVSQGLRRSIERIGSSDIE
jgi:TATA-box binding protein (TBP) (component of TFIID and TFIIIB)